MFKRALFLTFILSFAAVNAQSKPVVFQRAMEAFENKEYLIAHDLFSSLKNHSDVDNEILSTAFYYSAECLNKEGQTNGAAAEFEVFIRDFPLSNFRDEALYKLGIIYFKSLNYAKAREKLITLVNDYPNSEYFGEANYWIGEAFISENRLLEAEEFLLQSLTVSERNAKLDYSIYSLGNLYERKGNYEKAVSYYDELLSYYSESILAPYAQLRIGISYYRLNDYENAILELTDPRIFELPQDLQIEGEYVLANAYSRAKRFNEAKTIFQEILDRTPEGITEDQIKYGLGWVNFQTNQFDEAYKIFHSLIASLEDSIRIKSLYWSAECKRYMGQIDEAAKIYQQFLNLYPDHVNAYAVKFNIGIIYYNKKEYEKSLRFLYEASNSPDVNTKARALTLMAEINLDKKKYDDAKALFEQAQATLPNDFKLKNRIDLGLGSAYYFTNSFVAAIDVLEKLRNRTENFEPDKLHFYLGESYFARGNFSKARDNFKRIAPTNGEVGRQSLYGLAYSYFNLRDYANASYYFKEYTKLFPKDELKQDAMLRLADCYFGLKDFDLAVKEYENIFANTRKNRIEVRAHFQFAQALFKNNQPYKAIQAFRDLQIIYPKSKYADDAQYMIGWILFKQNDFQNAISEYFKIPGKYSSSPLIPLVYYSIGDCYFNLAQYEEAVTFYTTVVNDYPNSKYVFDAINGITYSYLVQDLPDNAAAVINNYIALNPTSKFGDQILYKKGELYYNVGDFEAARLGYKEFIATYPQSKFVPDAYYWIGKASENLGHIEDAIYNFNLVKENYLYSNVGISAVLELGRIYTERNDPVTALANYNYIIEKLPEAKGIEEVKFKKAKVLLSINKLNEAYKELNDLTVYYDGSVFADKAKVELGLLELARSNYENAKSLFKTVSEKRKDDIGAEAQYYYGSALFDEGNINDAISALVRVRSVFSRYDIWFTKALIKLGDCYAKIGDKRNAREMYRAALKRHSKDDLGKEAKKKLRRL